MNTSAATLDAAHPTAPARPRLDYKAGPATTILFIGLLAAGLLYTAYSLMHDVTSAGVSTRSIAPFLLLGVALLIALGFEFVNGFHDTANAVATVIYTHSLPPHVAVLWSGAFNFLGVLASSGAVAFGIISLLPVELILQVGSSAGFAMVFALLIAAILWNLGTWWLGLPASSSHTLIGSIVGVGIANALMRGRDGTSGVDWSQVTKIGESLLLSPLVGFIAAALLLLALRVVIKNRKLFEAPKSHAAPPWWIRGVLVLTCTGVSFAHGSNDGQKGMGLIMLILVGTVPLAYALNRAMPAEQVAQFAVGARKRGQVLQGAHHARQHLAVEHVHQARGPFDGHAQGVRVTRFQQELMGHGNGAQGSLKLFELKSLQQFADRLGADHGGEAVLAVFVLRLQVLVFRQQLTVLERGQTGLENNVVFEIQNPLEILQRHVEQKADTGRQRLQEPDVRNRCGQFDMAHALAPDPRQRHFDRALLADDALVLHALVLAAQALVVLDRPENTRAEQAVALGLEGAVVDGLRLLDLAVGPRQNLLRGRD